MDCCLHALVFIWVASYYLLSKICALYPLAGYHERVFVQSSCSLCSGWRNWEWGPTFKCMSYPNYLSINNLVPLHCLLHLGMKTGKKFRRKKKCCLVPLDFKMFLWLDEVFWISLAWLEVIINAFVEAGLVLEKDAKQKLKVYMLPSFCSHMIMLHASYENFIFGIIKMFLPIIRLSAVLFNFPSRDRIFCLLSS
jgi:hypothetical protein